MRSIAIRFMAACAVLLLVPACAVSGACCGACDPCAEEDPCAAPAAAAAPVADVIPATDMCPGEPARPPNAQPGEAWCRVWQPPEYRTVTERVMVKPAVRKKVWIPPEYGSRMKIVCVAPAKLAETTRPGLYTQRKKDVLACPPSEYWAKVDCGNGGKQADGTIQCECYQKKTRGPVFRTECERVCLQPAQRCLSYKPAEYKAVAERVLLKEGFCETYCEPAQYEDRVRTECVKPGCWKWVRNEDCEVPEESLPALEVRMEDKAPDGSDAGVFKLGSMVRYDLTLLSDAASVSMPNLKVVFTLPEHLEFVEGGGSGISVTGSGQGAQSAVFPLSTAETKQLQIIVKVISVPATNLVQLTASVQTEDGTELALETESTTLANGE